MNASRSPNIFLVIAIVAICSVPQAASASRITLAGTNASGAGGWQVFLDRGDDFLGTHMRVTGEVSSVVDLEARPGNRVYARERTTRMTAPGGTLVTEDLVVLDGLTPRYFRMEVAFSEVRYEIQNDNFALSYQSGDFLTWQSTFHQRMTASTKEVVASWKLIDELGSAEGIFPEVTPGFYYGQYDHREQRLGFLDLPASAEYSGGDWTGHFETESSTAAIIDGFNYGYPNFWFNGIRFSGSIHSIVPEPDSVVISLLGLAGSFVLVRKARRARG